MEKLLVENIKKVQKLHTEIKRNLELIWKSKNKGVDIFMSKDGEKIEVEWKLDKDACMTKFWYRIVPNLFQVKSKFLEGRVYVNDNWKCEITHLGKTYTADFDHKFLEHNYWTNTKWQVESVFDDITNEFDEILFNTRSGNE